MIYIAAHFTQVILGSLQGLKQNMHNIIIIAPIPEDKQTLVTGKKKLAELIYLPKHLRK